MKNQFCSQFSKLIWEEKTHVLHLAQLLAHLLGLLLSCQLGAELSWEAIEFKLGRAR